MDQMSAETAHEACPGAHYGQQCNDLPEGPCGDPATVAIVLVGGPFDEPPMEYLHCARCDAHWRVHHPERVEGEQM
jgi:hypothetical protein